MKLIVFLLIVLTYSITAHSKTTNVLIEKQEESKLLQDLKSDISENIKIISITEFNTSVLLGKNLLKGDVIDFTGPDGNIALVFERMDTPKYDGVIHWRGSVSGFPNSRVRLTIDSASIFGNTAVTSNGSLLVSGVVEYDDKRLNIRPINGKGRSMVFTRPINSNKIIRRKNADKAELRARMVEARGLRSDMLSDFPRNKYSIGITGSVSSIVGLPESVKIKGGRVNDSNILDLIEQLSPLYPLINSEKFTITSQYDNGERNIYRIGQSINDIPIEYAGLSVQVDSKTGQFIRAHGHVIPDTGYSVIPDIPEATAIAKARKLQEEYNSNSRFQAPDIDRAVIHSYLLYRKNPDITSSNKLLLTWAVSFEWDGAGFGYYIDATTGKTESASTTVYSVEVCDWQFYQRCDRAPTVIAADGFCVDATKCTLDAYKLPYEAGKATMDAWDDINASSGDVGYGGKQDIIANIDLQAKIGSPSGAIR